VTTQENPEGPVCWTCGGETNLTAADGVTFVDCPDCPETPEGLTGVTDVIADLDSRIDRAAATLADQAAQAGRSGRPEEQWRLSAKRTGLLVVKDWLRSYGDTATQENPEGLRCDGSHAFPARRHVFGCFRSTLADDVEDHPNWQENPEGLAVTDKEET
jgi:hypothetical protein